MKKSFILSIPIFFIGLMLFGSCSQDDCTMLAPSKTSSMSVYMKNKVFEDYTELGKIPEEYAKTMDVAEREAWQKLSTKYYIKKNAFSSKFYQKHKADILKRIDFLYQLAVKKDAEPSYLSFIWADRETALKKALRLMNYEDSTVIGDSTIIEEPPIGTDTAYIDNPPPRKVTYGTVECVVYRNSDGNQYMGVYADYKVIEERHTITIEPDGNSYYQLFPFSAGFNGIADLFIDKNGIATCSTHGEFRVGDQRYPVRYYGTFDLIEHWRNSQH